MRYSATEVRDDLPGEGSGADAIRALIADVSDADLLAAIRNLGGHDMRALDDAFCAIDDSRPTVIFAYTVKAYGLATEGHPQNHSTLLTEGQLAHLASRVGASLDDRWAKFPVGQPRSPRVRIRGGAPAP